MNKLTQSIAQAWPRISVTSKLDGIRSWSLQALDTCPGSLESPGVLVDACKGCYATTGNYVFANVKAPREFNRTDWQRLDWTDNMVQEMARDEYFRWLDSGDLYSLALAEKVLEVMLLRGLSIGSQHVCINSRNFCKCCAPCRRCLMYRSGFRPIALTGNIFPACMALLSVQALKRFRRGQA